MTDPAPAADPPTGPRPRRRRHPARTSRIVVTGLSAATMFGIVAAIGAGDGSTDPTQTAPAATVGVDPATTVVPSTVPATLAPTTEPSPVTELSGEPIQLTAEPDVQVVEVPAPEAQQEPAPDASTSGSR